MHVYCVRWSWMWICVYHEEQLGPRMDGGGVSTRCMLFIAGYAHHRAKCGSRRRLHLAGVKPGSKLCYRPWRYAPSCGVADLEGRDPGTTLGHPRFVHEEDSLQQATIGSSRGRGDAAAEEGNSASVFFDVTYFQQGWWDEVNQVVRNRANEKLNPRIALRYETEASRKWDLFYRRNSRNFFKDRHYLLKEFWVLREALMSQGPCDILEVGCGVGNTMVSLSKQYEKCRFFGVDFAASAVELLNGLGLPRCKGFVYDITNDASFMPEEIPNVGIATCIFVLSALAPEKMRHAVQNIIQRLNPGGFLCFRDYGMFDQSQLRFPVEQRISRNYYLRSDGTRSFFFTLEGVQWLFEQECGLECVEARYIRRVVTNHGSNLKMRRVFINAIYRKPV